MNCISCCSSEMEKIIDLGLQPICHHFIPADQKESCEDYKFPLSLQHCSNCGLIQLGVIPPLEQLQPRYDWINYREPEAHLDDFADRILSLLSPDNAGIVAGVSYKDTSLVDRLVAKGKMKSWMLDVDRLLKSDAGIYPGTETIQALTNREVCMEQIRHSGLCDVLICRHILEHSFHPADFLDALTQLLKPNGYIVLEVPSNEKSFEIKDYTVPWEEHTVYFMGKSLKFFLQNNNWEVISFQRYPYPQEDVLAVVVQKNDNKDNIQGVADAELQSVRQYGQAFPDTKRKIRDLFEQEVSRGRKIAAFGAGHSAISFINTMEIAHCFECIIDDHPKKQGFLLPGSGLPIVDSSILQNGNIDLCLLCVNPEIETKIINSKSDYIANGGTFVSAFPVSDNYILKGEK